MTLETLRHFVWAWAIWIVVSNFISGGYNTAIDMKFHPDAPLRQRLGFIIRNGFQDMWESIAVALVALLVPTGWYIGIGRFVCHAFDAVANTTAGLLLIVVTFVVTTGWLVTSVGRELIWLGKALFGIENGVTNIETRRSGS
jgi:hypothetical protein